jgi:hypothetical protein
VYWYGEEAGFNMMAMELLNQNIEELFTKKYKYHFSLMTILLLVD